MATINIEQFVADLLERNRALYGDARMEAPEGSEGQEPKDDDKPAEGDKPDEDKGDPKDDGKGSDDDKGDEPKEDELPEWARKELTKVRGEAAGYRTRLRDAEARLSEAKTPEEIEAAVKEFKDRNAELEHELLVVKIAQKHGLPEELAARLKGATPEELEKDAKALQKFIVPATPESLGGGLDPNDDDDGETDPRKLARKIRR